jgi:hypothetical protein
VGRFRGNLQGCPALGSELALIDTAGAPSASCHLGKLWKVGIPSRTGRFSVREKWEVLIELVFCAVL